MMMICNASQLSVVATQCHNNIYPDFNDNHNKYFVASSVEELFRTVDIRNVLAFIKETHFFITSYDVVVL